MNNSEKDKIYSVIQDLVKKLNKWEHEYYVLSNPSVSDEVYDNAYKTLKEYESKYPEFILSYSPTQRIGSSISNKFTKVKHDYLMLSLNNCFNFDELINFNDNIAKISKSEKNSYVLEPKIDGLSISLIYENGLLIDALTRGDGVIGESVFSNIKTIKTIPLKIDTDIKKLVIRGEVYVSNKDFEEINSSRDEDKKFANSRNYASGSLRNIDVTEVAKRKLNAFFYYIPNSYEVGFKTQYEVIEKLKKWGFNVAKEIKLFNNIKDVYESIKDLEKNKNNLDYRIDGAVIKYNNFEDYEKIGYTSKFPKWAIAYKFAPTQVETKLKNIILNVGRTGKLTFVAELEPVELEGSIITYATLHNIEYINELDIRVNDYVYLIKAAEIIPKVIGVNFDKRKDNCVKFEYDFKCPSCKSDLAKKEEEVDWYCINDECSQKQLQYLIYYCSKPIMNIEGLSESTLEVFFNTKVNDVIKECNELIVNQNVNEDVQPFELLENDNQTFISNILDIYKLEKYKEIIIKPWLKKGFKKSGIKHNFRFQEKSFDKLINNINESKNRELYRLLAALNIKFIGVATAKSIASAYNDIDKLRNLTVEDYTRLADISNITANSIHSFFSSDKNWELIEKLKELNINTKDEINNELVNESSIYFGKKIVITGSFSISRNEIIKKLSLKYKIKFVNNVSKNVDYLLAGNKPTAKKINEAKELNIPIIQEEIWN
ncbi:NAD-dependent DNA ligase LigA [Mycoplasma sp. T363T]|uniref:NAD-dependent DNA ligase LigA n=1 Tax=Mycoplasma bradburyae TaxID=2963128 RepID=UPI0023423CF4|nr:NAD-dependent DNA ligase LigA [Mycoplasma bradburyae]MDC4163190.1 NAD-dependent DNA ligase LigA [Mycoplasma bradburyae]